MIYPKKKVYNPLASDYTTTYDINGDGKPLSFTIGTHEIAEFDSPVADHLKKHIAHELATQLRVKGTYEDALAQAIEQIERPLKMVESI